MSKTSQSSEQDLPWQVSEIVLPVGRNPDIDLFKDDFVARLVQAMHKVPKNGQESLQRDLRDVARRFITIALTAPLGLPDGPARKTIDQ